MHGDSDGDAGQQWRGARQAALLDLSGGVRWSEQRNAGGGAALNRGRGHGEVEQGRCEATRGEKKTGGARGIQDDGRGRGDGRSTASRPWCCPAGQRQARWKWKLARAWFFSILVFSPVHAQSEVEVEAGKLARAWFSPDDQRQRRRRQRSAPRDRRHQPPQPSGMNAPSSAPGAGGSKNVGWFRLKRRRQRSALRKRSFWPKWNFNCVFCGIVFFQYAWHNVTETSQITTRSCYFFL